MHEPNGRFVPGGWISASFSRRVGRGSFDTPTAPSDQEHNTMRQHIDRTTNGRWTPGASPNPGGRPKTPTDVRSALEAGSLVAAQRLVDLVARTTVIRPRIP